MKRKVIVLIGALFIWQMSSFESGYLRAQGEEEDFFDGDEAQEQVEEPAVKPEAEQKDAKQQEAEQKAKEKEEEARKAAEAKRAAEEAKRAAAEAKRAAEVAKREAIKKQQLQDRKAAEEREKELDAYREAALVTSEYTLDPSSVELVVELEPNAYGFRTRAHRMTIASELDLILRGRAVLHYDFRFFNYLSFGLMGGIDWTEMSLFSRFRESLNKPTPRQLTALGGLSAKWRLTEWYMRSAMFLEPSILFGHLWQTLGAYDTKHWRLRPGLFAGLETVFDSGFTTSFRLGVEFPFDFGAPNPVKEVPVEPLFVLGFGFAI